MSNQAVKRHIFQPGAMSIIQMGEELIGHPTTAINELVKNGYDADATLCYIYANMDGDESFVCIFDNGLGMDSNTLFGDWLHPSISSKRIPGAKSEYFKRSFLGSKGIGRLAAMALGKTLTVISKTSEDTMYNWLSLNSELFRSEKLLNEVDFPGDGIEDYIELFNKESYLKERNGSENETLLKLLKSDTIGKFKEGTIIVIEDIDLSLKTIFNHDFEERDENEDIVSLADTSIYRSLSVLLTPLTLNSDIQKELLTEGIIEEKKEIALSESTFDVYFGTNVIEGLKKFDFIKVKPISLLQKYDYRLLGKVDKKGNVYAKYSCQRLESDSFTIDYNISNSDVFTREFRRLKTKRKPTELSEEEWNADAGEFYFDFRIYDRGEEDSRERLYSLVKANSLSQKKKIIDSLLGIRISKNGFGVKPYGEESKDWLDLSQIRVQNPGQNLSINQILGYVFYYSPENDGLKEKTNREGFYENKAFINSKEILRVIFKNIGQLRYNYRLKQNLGRIPQNKLQRPDTQTFLTFLKENQNTKSIIKKTEEFVEEISTALDNMEDTLSFSQRLASLGTGLELVYHELTQPIAKIGGSRAILKQNSSKILDSELREVFINEATLIGSYVAQLDELKRSLKPAIGKSREELFKPNHTFKKVCYLFKKDIEENDINLIFQKGSDQLEIEDYEYALWVTFLNIVNNAVYWLKLNKHGSKIIYFGLENSSITIQNNGPKIPEDSIDLIFEYGYTLKKEKNATGLGLAFSKNILNLNSWEIFAENRNEGPTFIISKQTENEKT